MTIKRNSNERRKATMARCWERGEKRKKERREAQERAHASNVKAGISPWFAARAARKARRATERARKAGLAPGATLTR